MFEKLGLVPLQKAIQEKIKANTGLKAFDAVPLNEPAPFYYVQVTGKRDASSKTMFREVFSVWIHAIAEEGTSSVGVFDLIQKVEEALTEDIELPEGYNLQDTIERGIQSLQDDPSGEKHAIVQFDFTIFYGYKCKI